LAPFTQNFDFFLGDPQCLQPLPHLVAQKALAFYFYGGGYANQWWSEAKISQAELIADWLRQLGQDPDDTAVFMTGIQADRQTFSSHSAFFGWVEKACIVRLRDPDSAAAAAQSFPQSYHGSDDAMGMLLDALSVEHFTRETPKSCWRVGVHCNFNYYSFESKEQFIACLHNIFVEIRKKTHLPIELVPLIAYEGMSVYESEYIPLLEQEFAQEQGGIKLCDALDFSLGKGIDAVKGLDGILACSYHISMMGALAGKPTLFVTRNAYYSQKVGGLRTWFDEGVLRNIDFGVSQKTEYQEVDYAFFADFLLQGDDLKKDERNAYLQTQYNQDVILLEKKIVNSLMQFMEKDNQFLAHSCFEAKAQLSRSRTELAHYLRSLPSDALLKEAREIKSHLPKNYREIYKTPKSLFKNILSYHFLRFLSRYGLILPGSMRRKFERSATKRNPYLMTSS